MFQKDANLAAMLVVSRYNYPVLLVRAVEEFPVPTSLKGLQRFLGLASHYRRFIPQFAQVAHPLHYLTRKDVPFHWDTECQATFDDLKS